MACALASALSGLPVRRDVAMTGEITLRGRVLAIGGLKEKTLAAYAAGVGTVLIPKDNEVDLEDVDVQAKDSLTFVFCSTVEDILRQLTLLPVMMDLPCMTCILTTRSIMRRMVGIIPTEIIMATVGTVAVKVKRMMKRLKACAADW